MLKKDVVEKVKSRPFFKRYVEVGVREGLFSDIVGALGRVHDKVVECVYLELIIRIKTN